MKRAFDTFGYDLKDPHTDVKLNIPKSFKATYNYKLNQYMFEGHKNLDETTDSILNTSWSNKLTYTLPEKCALCGSSTNVEMHHLRSVDDVRQKIHTGDAT